MFYYDFTYFLYVVPALLIAGLAQMMVKSTFARYSQMASQRGYTAAQVARMILDENGLRDVRIEGVHGELTDHYDPRSNVVRLSDSVYNSTSIASIGVAAHEVGHAVQHAQGYLPLQVRNAIIPITNIGSRLSFPIILLGVFFEMSGLITLGLVAFSLATIFQLITLPVEFNASGRALTTLAGDGFLNEEEMTGARKVLSAAALTYVAALIVSAAQLLRLFIIYGNPKRNQRD